jgi:hypothetical protein
MEGNNTKNIASIRGSILFIRSNFVHRIGVQTCKKDSGEMVAMSLNSDANEAKQSVFLDEKL